ncbi:GlcNAc-PI de-N-acetylase [Gemmatimonadetes bacterium T265]|nr:GlcNAc-PI de-N-acetylase [Gemmatimonadetes bacterium T265]
MPHDLLLLLAHPDDESFFIAGTAARLAAAGRPAGLVCATRGQAGALGPADASPLATRETIGAVREQELRDACAAVHLDLVALLDYEDRQLGEAHPDEIRATLVRLIRAERPRVVATFDPNGVTRHPDHVAISRFTADAVPAAADPRWAPELGAAHRVRRVVWPSPAEPWTEWRPERLVALGGVDYVVDTTAHAAQKEAALAAHRTQQGSVRPLWYDKANRAGAARRVFDVETFRHAWGEPPPRVPAADVFEGLDG